MAAKFHLGVDLNAQRAQNAGDATQPTDLVTKQQMDAAIRGLDWKEEVVAASTGNVSLAAPGASMDGVTLANPSRVLLKDQTAPAENGIYVWTGAAAALTRALDADSGPELSGSTVTVQRGTVNAERVYRVTADDPITLGTTAITLAQVGGASQAKTAGNGLTEDASSFNVGQGNGITVEADSIKVDPAVVVRKVAGDNIAAATTDIAHNFGHRDVQVQVWNKSTNQQEFPDISLPDLNTARVTFASSQSAGAFRIVVQG